MPTVLGDVLAPSAPSKPAPLPNLREFDDHPVIRKNIMDGVLSSLQQSYPRENARYRLELHDLGYADQDNFSLKEQKQAILQGKSLVKKLNGTWKLVDKATDKVVEEKPGVVAHVPWLSDRGTFVYKGSEYTIANQMRLKSGVYTRLRDNGVVEAHFNALPGKGMGFKLYMEPDTGIFRLGVGQSTLKLYPILRSMGVADKEIEQHWGRDLLQKNIEAEDPRAVGRAFAKLVSTRADQEFKEPDAGELGQAAEELSEKAAQIGARLSNRKWTYLWYPGKLRVSEQDGKNWVLLDVHKGLCTAAYDSLKSEGVECEPHYENPHISVLRPEECAEVKKRFGVSWRGAAKEGKKLRFRLTKMVNLVPAGWDEMDRVWFLECESPDLVEYRKDLGFDALPIHPEREHEIRFHVTFAVHRNHAKRAEEILFRSTLRNLSDFEKQADEKGEGLKSAFEKIELDPEVTNTTLGQPYANAGPPTLLRASKKLLNILQSKEDVDDRDSLAFQQIYGPEDFFTERVRKDAGQIGRKLLWQATLKGSLKHVPSGALTPQMTSVLLKSGLGQPLEEVNPIEVYDQSLRMLRMGAGGISSMEAVPDESRSVQPSHLGFIDPVRTPESASVGIDQRVTYGARKGSDGQLYSRMLDRKGKPAYISAGQASRSVIAFPGEMEKPGRMVRAMVRSRNIEYVDRGDVDYAVPGHVDMFTATSNMVPLISGIKGGRLLMGAKFAVQALPLQNPEAPLVQSVEQGDRSFQELYGNKAGILRARDRGVVTRMDRSHIAVRYAGGETVKHELYDHFPLNRKTFLHNTPMVRTGDRVAPGQLLAKSNYTDDNGTLALGTNLRTAYLPYRGSVTQDTHVFWRDAKGNPHFGPVGSLHAHEGMQALALNSDSLDAKLLLVHGFVAHFGTKVLNVKTNSGRAVKATANHSFMEVGENGQLVESAADKLRPKLSWLPRLKKVELPETEESITVKGKRGPSAEIALSPEFGFVCGMYAAEGYVAANKTVQIAVMDPDLRKGLIERLIACNLPFNDNSNTIVSIYWAPLAHWMKREMGGRSQAKRVPDVAFGASKAFREEFISGFWAGDGRVSSKGDTPTDTDTLITSRILRDGLGLLMASVGIRTTHGEYDDNKYTEGKIYRLGVCTEDTGLIRQFPHTVKWDRLKEIAASCAGEKTSDRVPLFESVKQKYFYLGRGRERVEYNRIQAQVEQGSARRVDVLKFVPEDVSDGDLKRLRRMAEAELLWDRVEEVNDTNYEGWVYDFDMRPLRTFVCVDTLVVHNSNYEDAVVISESGAKKLSSEHMYQNYFEKHDEHEIGRRGYVSIFPTKFNRAQLDTVDDNGAVRPGTQLKYGDPVVLALSKTQPSALHRGHKAMFTDSALTWEHEFPGEVVDVDQTREGGWNVTVKSYVPAQEGDKVAGAYGDKGVISRVIPDTRMIHDKDGKPFDMLLNPLGMISRGNPSQIYEALLGKIARAQGKPVKVPAFMQEPLNQYVKKQLALARLKDTEDLYDPPTGRKIPDVLTGERFVYKLHHTSESKGKGRGDLGSYTAEGVPAPGSEHGSKRISNMEINSLLSHGAVDVLRDAQVIRGQRNDDFWRAFRLGYTPPPPKVPMVYEKFLAFLQGAGINVVKKPDYLQLLAMTDKDVDKLSAGEIKSRKTVEGDTMLEVPGGLFDRSLTGGHHGAKWSHISLNEPIPNPIMEEPIRRMLGLTQKRLEAVYGGKEELGGKRGPEAIAQALKNINLESSMEFYRGVLRDGPRSKRDNAAKVLGYMKTMQRAGLQPSDFMITKVPVLPPAFRPITQLDKMRLVSDPNQLYGDLMLANTQLADMKGQVDDSQLADERMAVYNGFKAVAGLGDPIQAKTKEKKVKGLLRHVFGASPKCYDDATEILTRNGWIPYPEYQGGVEVGTLNPETDAFEWQMPNAVIHQPYSGKMVHTKTSQIDLLVTPNHEHWLRRREGHGKNSHWTEFEKVRADALVGVTCRVNYKISATKWTGIEPELSFSGVQAELPVFAEFLGLWLADGWNHSDGGITYLAFSEHSPKNELAASLLDRLGLPYARKEYTKQYGGKPYVSVYWSVKSKDLVSWLSENVGVRANEKRLSRFILSWPKRLLERVLFGYLAGDGEKRIANEHPENNQTFNSRSALTNGSGRFSTTSLSLVSDLQELSLKVGVRIKLTRAVEFENPNWNSQYHCSVTGWDKATVEYPEQTQYADYSGYVHCVTVPNGLVFVRRAGIPSVSGNSGLFQRRVIGMPVDVVGRAAITPNPEMNMDQVGIPENKVWTVYRPFVVRKLVRAGMPATAAAIAVANQTEVARKALDEEIKQRPVLLNRAPTLHRFGFMAAWPVIVKGNTLQLSPVVCGGFNADFDGDVMNYHVPVTDEAVKDAVEKMMPSRNLKAVSDFKVHYLPKNEFLLGLHLASTSKDDKKPVRIFRSKKDVLDAYTRGEINPSDKVQVRG
jgi:DNA-directed RNA polymerase beta subunit